MSNHSDDTHSTELSPHSEHQVRLAKVARMRERGIEPWPPVKAVDATAKDVLSEFGPETEGKTYHVAGRLVSIREHGKTVFGHLQDRTGKLQLYIKQDNIGQESFDQFQEFVDVGDIIWVAGTPFRTKTGEVTLKINELTLLSKCLYPLPEKFHGLQDIETRYRQRYLDLISNPESREKFVKRSHIVRYMRDYFDDHDFIEVETPMLHPIAGGATARPFVTHHNAYDIDLYLRIAPELYLKRLVVGGLERVYEINRNFRNEGISTRHNPEFTMAEFYIAHHDYHFMMDYVEDMLRTIVEKTCGAPEIPFGDHMINFAAPFERISMAAALIKYSAVSADDLTEGAIDATLKKYKVTIANKKSSLGAKIFALFEELVEDKLIQPTYITGFPIEVSPLAKRDPQDHRFASRFELFIAGMELSNGFNELNDPLDQADRFHEQLEAHKAGDDEAHQFDADYIHALEYALPPTVGCGIGIDRLAMILTNTTSIKDVILFPTLKPKE